jgi:pyruvate kinase
MVPSTDPSTKDVAQVDYLELLKRHPPRRHPGFGDGAVVVEVISNTGDALEVRVIHGGVVTGRPGVHIPSDRLRIPTPTPTDLVMLGAFIDVGVDMAAVSFVRSARRAPSRRQPHPRGPIVVAKIGTGARSTTSRASSRPGGDHGGPRRPGHGVPIEELPHLQKAIIQKCISLGGRPSPPPRCSSRWCAPTPTGAEASDVVARCSTAPPR